MLPAFNFRYCYIYYFYYVLLYYHCFSMYTTWCFLWFIGWGKHPVCAKRYHLIIRNNRYNNGVLGLKGLDEPECLVHEDPNHLLHGLVHSNGFGHLISLNRIQGVSQILTGSDLMRFWDSLCKVLGVRLGIYRCSTFSGEDFRPSFRHGPMQYCYFVVFK
jgi:hypothetical protein